MIRHFVHLRFRQDVKTTKKHELFERLNNLVTLLEDAIDFQYRQNVSFEINLVRGFDDMFWIDFVDADALNLYLMDEEHNAIGTEIVECLVGKAEGVFVCDINL
ncbi:Dabb family protein [Amylibacter sp.]|nr:Dabb family protein [Amylibacter sp.]|tara:strand:+ start:947 stop:1258 length:312 start_codon:yes stop_codon:yes gene_type:complete